MASLLPGASWALAALLAAGPGPPAGSLGAGADVVVLAGLPGDVETEKEYQDQLGRLLALLARPECRPRALHLLVDAPAAVRLPEGLAAEVAPASRASLLDLAGRLGGEPGPRLLIAWGHGGRQGAESVFHVRGPRLTAADLSRLLPAAGAARALLFFRGSGEFARALAGRGRELLASENAQAFRSDPVGLELALRLWAERPALSFEELADLLGRDTQGFYDERHLARQEEPTLWAGTAAPRPLARARTEAEAAGSAAPAREAGSPSADAWSGIVPVEPSTHPGADAVVLRSRTAIVLGEDPAIRIESDELVQVLTAEGTRRADVALSFSPPGEDLAVLDAEVRLRDGTLLRLPAEEVREARAVSEGDYVGPARRAFSLPHAAPGVVLRLHVRREWKRFPLPHVFLEAPLADADPVLDAELELRVGERSVLHYASRNLPPSEPAITETRYGRVYTWKFHDLEPLPDEPLAPPDRVPRLLFSTFPDWDAFASWYRGLVREADQLTPELEARARELTAGARGDREKVAALYDEVTGLRYVAVPLGVNSHRPHAAANVLRNRYGDCKDKANLFNTLLRAVGIQADLVLVPRFGQADEAVPGLAFNHAISRVRLGDDVIWADTTDDVSRFGLLPPGDPGRKVLVVAEGPAALTTLPAPRPEDQALSLEGSVELRDAGAATASFSATSRGFADYALRSAARAAGAPRAGEPVLERLLRLTSGRFALRDQRQTPVTALDVPFAWRGEGSVLGLLARLPGGRQRLLRAPLWLPREWDLALHARRSPLLLNQGYPLQLQEQVELRLPPGAGAPVLPEPRGGDTGPLRWSVRWAAPAPGLVRVRLELTLESGELDPAGTAAFQAQLAELVEALADPALLPAGS